MNFCSKAVPVLLSSVLLGCDGLAGPCEHTYLDPVLEIVRVTDAEDQTAIGEVALGHFSLDGNGVEMARLAAGPAFGIEVEGQEIICTVACGFGVEQGTYRFRVRAAGYAPLDASLDARYSEFNGGCPSSNSGGMRVAVELTPIG